MHVQAFLAALTSAGYKVFHRALIDSNPWVIADPLAFQQPPPSRGIDEAFALLCYTQLAMVAPMVMIRESALPALNPTTAVKSYL